MALSWPEPGSLDQVPSVRSVACPRVIAKSISRRLRFVMFFCTNSAVRGNSRMKKSTKAALLSALVFPGAGHIFLKKYIPGVALAGASLTGSYYLISKTVEIALKILIKIQSGDLQPDITTITELVTKQSTGSDAKMLNIATVALIICWLIGIIDSYRVGCGRDKIE